ncbi:MAG TPA: ABC transporter permease [Candidatus Acidoferrales bacterium]|nr:ABC transporter permease [Candidatus Acidoferrales bacterium]
MKTAAAAGSLPSRVGSKTLESLAYLGSLAQLAARSAYLTFVGPFQGRRFRPHRAIHQAMAVGVQAIPILSLISFLFGLIMALQLGHELKRFGMMQMIAEAVVVAVLRELGPLITAIVVIGRSGSAFAAEIGTKKVTEEVDALRTMAFDPVAFLVAPKFLAMLVMVPALAIWADLMGVFGGFVFGRLAAGFTFQTYFQATRDAIVLHDLYTGLVKAVLFGIVITAVGCREGFGTGAGAEEVGRSTTSAVVTSIFLVVAVDLIFTTLFYITG